MCTGLCLPTQATITASRYVSGIRTEVERLEKNLKLFSDTLDEWLECQKNWIYLESIFAAPDIQRQLPFESKAFFTVDKSFKDIMRRTKDRPNAMMAGTTPGWLVQRCMLMCRGQPPDHSVAYGSICFVS